MTPAPRHRRDDQADADEAVRAWQEAKATDEAHRSCAICARAPGPGDAGMCQLGQALRWKPERRYREAKAAVKALGFESVEAYRRAHPARG